MRSKNAMTSEELKAARVTLRMSQRELATQLRTPLRTYEDWEAGRRRIPGICQYAVELTLQRDKWQTVDIATKVTGGYRYPPATGPA